MAKQLVGDAPIIKGRWYTVKQLSKVFGSKPTQLNIIFSRSEFAELRRQRGGNTFHCTMEYCYCGDLVLKYQEFMKMKRGKK